MRAIDEEYRRLFLQRFEHLDADELTLPPAKSLLLLEASALYEASMKHEAQAARQEGRQCTFRFPWAVAGDYLMLIKAYLKRRKNPREGCILAVEPRYVGL